MAPRHSSSSAPATPPGVHLTEWAAEFAGTAFVLFAGLSAITADFAAGSPVVVAIPSRSLRLLLTGLLFAGSGSLVAVSPLGRRSGAHLNPVVTIAFWMRGMVHRHDLAGYMLAQLAGALAGTLVAVAAWGAPLARLGYGATVPQQGTGVFSAAAIEAAMTALLVGTILLMVSHRRTQRLTPLVVWPLIAVLVWQGARFTGTGLNPARSLWPELLAGRLDVYWVYVVGPLMGAAAAAGATRLALPRHAPRTAKLFHDSAYPSVFKAAP